MQLQVTWVPEVGLVSSSLDSTIKVYDFVREKVINTCTHHVKGVHSFVWCRWAQEKHGAACMYVL